MKKFLYCDSCFLITFYQDGYLGSLSQYKGQFFISKTQIEGELIKPSDLATTVRKNITVIEDDRDDIKDKANEFSLLYETLSIYDCLCMAYSILDGYCLITDDKALQKKCAIYGIEVKTSKEIIDEFLKMKYKCEECGAEMLNQSKGPYIHYVCPKCGNAYATYDCTKDNPIKFDEIIYSVKSVDNKASLDVLKIVSKISGNNYIKCKELIENNGIICSGKAIDIIASLQELKSNNIQFEINPTFEYEI